MTSAPTVQIHRSEDNLRWIVQIDTERDTGVVTVAVNDADIWEQDPETGQGL